MTNKKEAGFTLVELVVAMVCTSLVFMAAATFFLSCQRVGIAAMNTSSMEETERIVSATVETLATRGDINKIETDTDQKTWSIKHVPEPPPEEGGDDVPVLGEVPETDAETDETEADKEIVYLRCEDGNLYAGMNEVPLLEGIENFDAKIKDGLLTVSFDIHGKPYSTSVYCRTIPDTSSPDSSEEAAPASLDPKDQAPAASLDSQADVKKAAEKTQAGRDDMTQTESTGRAFFLYNLIAQFGSTGQIKGAKEGEPGYFSEWYIGNYADNPEWSPETPWCACFVSWGLDQVSEYLDTVPRFAGVDEGIEWFRNRDNGVWTSGPGLGINPYRYPLPGDIIFFDWDGDQKGDHVGAVYRAEDNAIFTLEGNASGQVGNRSYALDDSRILGWGTPKWKQTPVQNAG